MTATLFIGLLGATLLLDTEETPEAASVAVPAAALDGAPRAAAGRPPLRPRGPPLEGDGTMTLIF